MAGRRNYDVPRKTYVAHFLSVKTISFTSKIFFEKAAIKTAKIFA